MEAIDSIRINFNQDQLFLLNICLGFLMFGVALDLKFDAFKTILKYPKASFVGLTSQWILLPMKIHINVYNMLCYNWFLQWKGCFLFLHSMICHSFFNINTYKYIIL